MYRPQSTTCSHHDDHGDGGDDDRFAAACAARSPTTTTMTTTAAAAGGDTEPEDGDVADDDRVTINVSGLRFETRRSTLARHPATLLGNARRRRQHYDPVRAEYFFDRGRHSFDALLYYYQSGGNLHRPVGVPLDVFVDDLRFYQLDEKMIEKCCANEGIFRQKPTPLPKNPFQRKVRAGSRVFALLMSWLQLRFDFDSTAVRLLVKAASGLLLSVCPSVCLPVYLFRA